jgi:hypothetical protein
MRTLVIPDLHAPFQHPAALDFLADLKRRTRPQQVVCIGDEIDAHGWSTHERDPGAPGQADELTAALAFLRQLYRLFPRVKCCESNHTLRAIKAAKRAALPAAFLRPLRDVLGAPRGWEWAPRWLLDGVVYFHGEGFSGEGAARKAALAYRHPCVMGHLHSEAGVSWTAGPFDRLWGCSTGCLIDPNAVAFDYSRHSPKRPMLGAAVVLDGVPHFEPLPECRT